MTTNQLHAAEAVSPLVGASVLLVDDDPGIREEIAEYLESHGMQTETAADIAGARHCLGKRRYDLVLLDLWLGNENGFDFLRELRRSLEIPCIMITAQDDITDKIVGLELGADDYLFKPVNLRELLARMRALMRRAAVSAEAGQTPVPSDTPQGAGRWHFDPVRRDLLSPAGETVPLTTAECDLLITLVANEGRPQTREELSRCVFNRRWQPHDRSLDGVIVKLRRKLDDNPDNPQIIKTVRSRGYVFTGFPAHPVQKNPV
jgi:two-component system phosphate regulon response regulator OmpR